MEAVVAETGRDDREEDPGPDHREQVNRAEGQAPEIAGGGVEAEAEAVAGGTEGGLAADIEAGAGEVPGEDATPD